MLITTALCILFPLVLAAAAQDVVEVNFHMELLCFSPPLTHSHVQVQVASGGLVYNPNNITAPKGTIISFSFPKLVFFFGPIEFPNSSSCRGSGSEGHSVRFNKWNKPPRPNVDLNGSGFRSRKRLSLLLVCTSRVDLTPALSPMLRNGT
jgi:hypothetical protein